MEQRVTAMILVKLDHRELLRSCDLQGRGQQSGEQLLRARPSTRQPLAPVSPLLCPASAAKSISHDPVPPDMSDLTPALFSFSAPEYDIVCRVRGVETASQALTRHSALTSTESDHTGPVRPRAAPAPTL